MEILKNVVPRQRICSQSVNFYNISDNLFKYVADLSLTGQRTQYSAGTSWLLC